MPRPALLIHTSTRPNARSASWRMRSTSARRVTSTSTTSVRDEMSAATRSSASFVRAASTRLSPRRPSSRAMAAPMPALAPVMTVLCSLNEYRRQWAGGSGQKVAHAEGRRCYYPPPPAPCPLLIRFAAAIAAARTSIRSLKCVSLGSASAIISSTKPMMTARWLLNRWTSPWSSVIEPRWGASAHNLGPAELSVRRCAEAVGGSRRRCRTITDKHPRKPPDVLKVQAA